VCSSGWQSRFGLPQEAHRSVGCAITLVCVHTTSPRQLVGVRPAVLTTKNLARSTPCGLRGSHSELSSQTGSQDQCRGCPRRGSG